MLRKADYPRHHGFTFVELMIGIIVTSIVLCALSVFTFGVSQSWTQSESTQSVSLTGTMTVERLNQFVRSAQMIEPNPTPGSLDNSTSPATCMLWTDSNVDGKIEYSELAVFQYQSATDSIVEYTTTATTYCATLPSDTAFLSSPNIIATTVANHVTACQFFAINAASTTQHPSLEMVFKIASSSSAIPDQMVYNTATLRAPNGSPQ